MPEGRANGRSAATSIDGAEHGAMIERVMADARSFSAQNQPTRSDRELLHL